MLKSDLRVLFADDLPVMKKLVISILKQINITNIDTASNGEEALELMTEKQYDIVLTDWNMPVMNGLQLLQKIKSDPVLKKTPVILITAEDDKDQVLEAIKAGVNGYVIKPIKASTLQEKIISTLYG